MHASGARTQQHSAPLRVGILSPAQQTATKVLDVFRNRMRELGYVEGRNVVYEYRLNAGSAGSPVEMAVSLARLPVQVIVTDGGLRVAQAAHEATRTIPMVKATAPPDPVGAGLAASFARPGGNATGFALLSADLPPKRLELIRDILPATRVLAIWDPISGRAGIKPTLDAAQGRGEATHGNSKLRTGCVTKGTRWRRSARQDRCGGRCCHRLHRSRRLAPVPIRRDPRSPMEMIASFAPASPRPQTPVGGLEIKLTTMMYGVKDSSLQSTRRIGDKWFGLALRGRVRRISFSSSTA
jgi:hypothetical protein